MFVNSVFTCTLSTCHCTARIRFTTLSIKRLIWSCVVESGEVWSKAVTIGEYSVTLLRFVAMVLMCIHCTCICYYTVFKWGGSTFVVPSTKMGRCPSYTSIHTNRFIFKLRANITRAECLCGHVHPSQTFVLSIRSYSLIHLSIVFRQTTHFFARSRSYHAFAILSGH